jgi:hypothetical protein
MAASTFRRKPLGLLPDLFFSALLAVLLVRVLAVADSSLAPDIPLFSDFVPNGKHLGLLPIVCR